MSFIPGEDPDKLCLEGVPDPSLSPGEDPDLLLLEGVLGKSSFSSGEDAELLLSLEGVLGIASSTGEERVRFNDIPAFSTPSGDNSELLRLEDLNCSFMSRDGSVSN